MTYGEERLHFPDNLKPEKKSSKGWILIFMAVCIVCGVLIIVHVGYAQRMQYNIQCLLPTSNKYIQMNGKVVRGEDIISTVQDAIEANDLVCIEVVTLGGTVAFLHIDRTASEESTATLDLITDRDSPTYVDPVSKFHCSLGSNAAGEVNYICFVQK